MTAFNKETQKQWFITVPEHLDRLFMSNLKYLKKYIKKMSISQKKFENGDVEVQYHILFNRNLTFGYLKKILGSFTHIEVSTYDFEKLKM